MYHRILSKQHLNKSEILERNEKCNQSILEYLETFRITNGLEPCDIVILGSSAASYMQYLAICEMSDIDVYVLPDTTDIKRTSRIDTSIQSRLFIPSDFMDRVKEKDGYLFISETDFLISVVCALLYKQLTKTNYLLYARLMIRELGLSLDEFESLITSSIDKLLCDDETKDMLRSKPKNFYRSIHRGC